MIGYTNLELNNFDITLGSGDNSERRGIYFCFGKQQWGLQRMTTSYTTYNLPISYKEIHIAIIGQEQERNKGLGLSPDGLNGYIAAISYSGDTQNIRYLSIGYQQWGYEETNEIVTLLQAYTTAYIPVGCAALLDSLFSLTIQDNTSFYRPLRTTAVYWLTIGR